MEAEYIIVGAGSAGCAVAFRLAEAGKSVIVVEFGGSDAGPLIRMPGALSFPMRTTRYDWGYRTELEPGLGGRRLAAPRGRVLGGSSSINGMVWVRGHPLDYAAWVEAGAEGWDWRDVEPYFRRIETWDGGASSNRGHDGPVHVRRARPVEPLVRAYLEAGRQAGLPATDDYNGARQDGICLLDATIRNGHRWSAADAYLRPALCLGARLVRGLAARVVLEGRRVTGVVLSDARVVRARREVIVSASAFNSPKLLMLSGIGPAEELRRHGIRVVADRAGVGENLQDHLEVYVQVGARSAVGLHRHWSLAGRVLAGGRWLLARSGPAASNQFEAGAFLRSAPDVAYPDVQLHFLPLAVRYDGTGALCGYQLHAGPMRSRSRGRVTLRSREPADPPRIAFGYMSHPDDWHEMRTAIRLARQILRQPALAPHMAREIAPGDGVESDAALDDFVRDTAESAFHPCGTCRMGRRDDPLAVTDPEGRVIGVDALRVADSSIIPRITNGNLNAPSMMVGEKIADHILGRQPPG
ncbi:choline dehydrogenase [Roseitranquillus sediminis]|uniref:choline dehydrogenase n=1 Tax=Roseitranquillus sediminis TaxID=2809051 RepID=UPI001D0C6B52|nr:choline dehydrogenase [Roseitranquillus sediminis]MBM9594164.1 choline dehydrogenase [Roseitranquillus sediminis]